MFKTLSVQHVANFNYTFIKICLIQIPDEKSKIISHDNLNKKTLETIINEIFYKNVDENEHTIQNFKEE